MTLCRGKNVWYFYDELILLFLLDYHKTRIYPTSLRSEHHERDHPRQVLNFSPYWWIFFKTQKATNPRAGAGTDREPDAEMRDAVYGCGALKTGTMVSSFNRWTGVKTKVQLYIQIKSCQITCGHNNIFTHASTLAEECREVVKRHFNLTFVFQRAFGSQRDCIREMHSLHLSVSLLSTGCSGNFPAHKKRRFISAVVSVILRVHVNLLSS